MAFLRRNLKSCPEHCKTSAFIAIVSSVLDLSPIVWDPYYSQDIDKLERIQKQAARFITGNYKSREEGLITNMLKDLGLEPLKEGRSYNRLVFFYKVVEGLVPPIPPEELLQPVRARRQIKAKKYSDCETINIIDRQVVNNNRGYKVEQCRTEQYKNRFLYELQWTGII